MIRKRLSNTIIFAVLSAALLIAMALLFNWIVGIRQEYRRIYNYGHQFDVTFSIAEGFSGQAGRERWRFRFYHEGTGFTGVTAGLYTHADILGQQIRVVLDENNRPITYPVGGEAIYWEHNGTRYFVVALSREDGYFEFFEPPNFAMPLIVMGVLILTLFIVAFNLVHILLDKNVIRHGMFAYALIEDTFWSKWGSRRWIAIRFRYQDEEQDGEWKEAVSHYTFRPAQIAYLKDLEAIGIKHLRGRAVVVERFSTKGPIDPPF